ncbi:Xaa-Pro peptidase family protein [Thalassobaculum sp.]|uniref:M24 family metallopeptidase n=1 Tax=Thalassobaculum sp. TaxID=2022740 RepID=UPI0032EF80FF
MNPAGPTGADTPGPLQAGRVLPQRAAPAVVDGVAIDEAAVTRARLARLRAEMAARDLDAVVLLDPVNLRFATGTRNMQIFTARNPARYALVPVEGPVTVYEFHGAGHLAAAGPVVDRVCEATTVSYVAAGDHRDDKARAWARELAAAIREAVPEARRIGIEPVQHLAAEALAAEGFVLCDAQEPVERARARKTDAEIAMMKASLRVVEKGVHALRDAIRPGASENQVWAELHRSVIADDADYVETRLLNSGPRTNPWYQESSPRVIEANELVALDTDVVGPYGIYADFSRTFFSGPGKPSDEQRRLYRTAWEQIHHDVELVKAGRSSREIAEAAWPVPDEFWERRYFVLMHSVGLTGEYPYILHGRDMQDHGYDAVLEENMTLCVEAYIGGAQGGEGVKLEQQVRVTRDGYELLSAFPFEDELLSREV